MTRARSLSQLANSSVFTVATNNRVGIGSEIPTTKLDVDGALNVSGNAVFGGVITYEDVTNIDSVGIITARSGVSVPDGQKILLGTGNDLEIFHDGTDSIIDNNTGDLYVQTTGSGDDIIIRAADDVIIQTQGSEDAVIARGDGTVELYHNNSKKFETTSTGVSVTGAASFSGTSTINANGRIDAGAITLDSNLTPTSGTSIEAFYGGTGGVIQAYDRDNSNWEPLRVKGSNWTIDLDGSALFAGGDLTVNSSGEINVGGYNGGSTTTDGVLLGATGGIFSQMTAATAGTGVLFQGMHGSTYTSRIQANGAATFFARSSLGTTSLSDHAVVAINNNAANGVIVAQNMNNSGALLQGYNSSSAKTVEIFGSGAATFGNSTDYMKYTEADGLYRVTSGTTKWNLAANGSATFGSSGGQQINLRPGMTGSADAIWLQNSDNSRPFLVMADGSANFTGTTSIFKINPDSTVAAGVNNGSGFVSQLNHDGSATFNHFIQSARFSTRGALGVNVNGTDYAFAAYDASSNFKAGVDLNGAATFASQVSTSDRFDSNRTNGTYNVFNGRLNNSVTSSILANGSATFAGTVKSTKVSSGANDVLFLGQSDIGQSAGTLVDKFKVKTDGSAQFIGKIDANYYDANGIAGFVSNTTSNAGYAFRGANASGTLTTQIFATGDAIFAGSVSKGSGSFRIDHPLKPETHQLVHSFVEGPQADNIYRGKVELVDGAATVNIDTVAGMTEGTFAALNREIQCFTTNETGWTAIKGSVTGNLLTIVAQDNTCTDTISWLVIGERKDQHMYDTGWTDENGKVIVEPEKVV